MPTAKKKTANKNKIIKTRSKRKIIILDIVVAALTIGLVTISIWYTNSRRNSEYACDKPGAVYQTNISADRFLPDSLQVKRCDVVLVGNTGLTTYDLAFGSHNKLEAYPGFRQQQLKAGEYISIEAVKTGSYTLHDHFNNKASLQLTISE